jgi:ACS family pantothenate transporter-like MFS transporter
MIAACHTATSYFNLWLKAEGYSISKINYLPTGGNALAIVVTLAWGMIADRTGQFYWLIISLTLVMLISNLLLSIWTIPTSALLFAYYISYAGSAATPVLIVSRCVRSCCLLPSDTDTCLQAWATKLNAGDPNLRQLLVAVSNVVSYAWVLWVPRTPMNYMPTLMSLTKTSQWYYSQPTTPRSTSMATRFSSCLVGLPLCSLHP